MYKYLILISILLIVIYLYIKNKSNFWIYQPINNIFGYICNKNSLNKSIIKLDDNFKWNIVNNYNIIQKFINQYFYNNLILNYSKQFYEWSLYTPLEKTYNLGLFDKKNLIGFISAKPLNYKINDINYSGNYIDFLCLNPKFRKKGLTPKLISQLINIAHNDKYSIHIFKKERTPLPFITEICSSNYYYLDLKNYKLIEFETKKKVLQVNKNNIQNLFNYFISYVKKFKFYQIFSLEEFKHYFLPTKFLKSYIIIENEKIIGFINYIEYEIIIGGENQKNIEFLYLFGDILSILTKFINKMKYDKIKKIYINNIGNNQYFIKKFNMIKSIKIYYYLFNNIDYSINLKSNEIYLN